jgi:hypothetical protein
VTLKTPSSRNVFARTHYINGCGVQEGIRLKRPARIRCERRFGSGKIDQMTSPSKEELKAALDLGQMAHRMVEGYYMHLAAIHVAKDPRAIFLSPTVEQGQMVPIGRIRHKDGTRHEFHFTQYLAQAGTNPAIAEDLDRVWLVGALLTIGDALKRHSYFDHAPELELLYHLRNGVAHGNTFSINVKRLHKYPAHNRLAWVRSDSKVEFEITPNLQNQTVLFDFMAPGDILHLLMSVSRYLTQMGMGVDFS